MAEFASSFSTTCLMLLFFHFFFSGGEAVITNEGSKIWCIAKSSSTYPMLQADLDFACSLVDCSAIQPGASCYEPNLLINHASYAMNLYYQTIGNKQVSSCDFKGTGLLVDTDPSHGSCTYISS